MKCSTFHANNACNGNPIKDALLICMHEHIYHITLCEIHFLQASDSRNEPLYCRACCFDSGELSHYCALRLHSSEDIIKEEVSV